MHNWCRPNCHHKDLHLTNFYCLSSRDQTENCKNPPWQREGGALCSSNIEKAAKRGERRKKKTNAFFSGSGTVPKTKPKQNTTKNTKRPTTMLAMMKIFSKKPFRFLEGEKENFWRKSCSVGGFRILFDQSCFDTSSSTEKGGPVTSNSESPFSKKSPSFFFSFVLLRDDENHPPHPFLQSENRFRKNKKVKWIACHKREISKIFSSQLKEPPPAILWDFRNMMFWIYSVCIFFFFIQTGTCQGNCTHQACLCRTSHDQAVFSGDYHKIGADDNCEAWVWCRSNGFALSMQIRDLISGANITSVNQSDLQYTITVDNTVVCYTLFQISDCDFQFNLCSGTCTFATQHVCP